MLISLCLFVALATHLVQSACTNTNCNNAVCRCMSPENPGRFSDEQVPQLVMLTFDDAVNANNYNFYEELLLNGRRKDARGCAPRATFFVNHEYTNYAQLHHLWRAGNEIAVHTITHESNTDLWRQADTKRLTREMKGMREFISDLGQIPEKDIVGFRNPFLQTAGDTTFEVLQREGFLYDSSMPTREHAGEATFHRPIWPYTLDYGYTQDCIIHPCPNKKYPGFWEVPMISYFKPRVMIDGSKPVSMPCSMADACVPWPETKEDTYAYLVNNFKRHYLKNRSPFPLFLHESWLKDEQRRAGYLEFVDYLLEQDDVFIVTVKDVVKYMKNPVPLEDYQDIPCDVQPPPEKCDVGGKYCKYDVRVSWGTTTMNMFICKATCPLTYPGL